MLSFGNATSGFMLRTFFILATQNSNNSDTMEANTLYYQQIGKEINDTKCYGAYGCFPISYPWLSQYRPVAHFPEYPDKIKPGFWLFKNAEETSPFIFDLDDPETVLHSNMDVNLPIYVISHGYLENGRRPWMTKLRHELHKKHPCNVIIVDWGGGSEPPYTQAVANIRLVGAMLAHVLESIAVYSKNMNLDHVHVIGHSLGAHLAGYIGYTLQKEFNLILGRITGLDPAEPHFAKAKRPVRLGPSAAKYVDIIHTDANMFIRGGLGIIERIGHVDFFPNGGSEQPGCGKGMVEYISASEGSFVLGLKKFLGCNHIRSYEYFTESINSDCSFTAISCPSYEAFKNGSCFKCNQNGHFCIKFGYYSEKYYKNLIKNHQIKNGDELQLFSITGPSSPYCRGHYRISVKISENNESKIHGGEIGQLWFNVFSKINNFGRGLEPSSGRFPLNEGRYHEPGQTYQTVVPANVIQDFKAIQVEWQYHSSMFNPLTWRLLSPPKIYVTKVTIDNLETGQSLTACPKQQSVPLVTHVPQVWLPSYC